jgi:flagellar basal body-associated protein FliL
MSFAGALDDVFVVAVQATVGCGRLVAHVAIPASQSVSEVLEELRLRTPQLRAIVASFISRKRAPELSFMVAPLGGDRHD